jgi:hypothetical protein
MKQKQIKEALNEPEYIFEGKIVKSKIGAVIRTLKKYYGGIRMIRDF